MLTPFGKLIRKHRIDGGVLLKDMADGLNVSAAFLSAIETGKKSIPQGIVEKIASYLHLDIPQLQELKRAAEISANEFRIRLAQGATTEERDVAAMLARQFPSLSENDKQAIKEILERRRA